MISPLAFIGFHSNKVARGDQIKNKHAFVQDCWRRYLVSASYLEDMPLVSQSTTCQSYDAALKKKSVR